MVTFWRHVNIVIRTADIIIEVLDARNIYESRNIEIERKVKKLRKKILYVINKCDLADKVESERWKAKLKPSVFISSKDKLGTTILKKKLLEMSRGKEVVVGVLGYPNVGKSSLINALSGRGAAKTSSESGFTKGVQKVRVDHKILLIDTPGVLPDKEKSEFKHSKIGAISYSKLKDPESIALEFIEENKDLVVEHYGLEIEETDEAEEILEKLAFKLNRLRKGNNADLEATSRLLLKDWQTGKLNKKLD
ncbi:MAG: GTPase [archaeon]